jgi:Protein of unknown function (DUF3618)
MESQSARLEREVEETRWQLTGTLEELRGRMTPRQVVDQVIDYTRDSPAAEFFRNMGREVRENPLPLALIGIGIAWLLLASNRTSRAAIAAAADNLASKADDVGTATAAFVSRTSEWGQQTATRVADRATDVASTVGDKTAELAGRARDAADLADKARSASAAAVATFEKAKRPFTSAAAEAAAPKRGGPAVSSTDRKGDACVAEPIYDRG